MRRTLVELQEIAKYMKVWCQLVESLQPTGREGAEQEMEDKEKMSKNIINNSLVVKTQLSMSLIANIHVLISLNEDTAKNT